MVPSASSAAARAEQVEVVLQGDLTTAAGAAVRQVIAALGRYTRERVTYARVRLTRACWPSSSRPIILQANVRLGRRLIRVQVAAATIHEAIDLLDARLRQRLLRSARRGEARRATRATHRPEHLPRQAEDRQLRRRKTYAPRDATPEEAVEDMELLDYDFYLFTDRVSGQDAVVYRAGPTGYRLAALSPASAALSDSGPLTLSPQPAVRLTLAAAIERLNLTEAPFLFFADADTGRGEVLYRRYDGHYGLLSPAG